jgi:hypothetical protein
MKEHTACHPIPPLPETCDPSRHVKFGMNNVRETCSCLFVKSTQSRISVNELHEKAIREICEWASYDLV